MTETFGPLYERPKSQDCPNCSCCTAPLCERGRQSTMRCSGLTDASLMQIVSGCPCSADTTPGTHAWRAARIRVTEHATERPLHTPVAVLLRTIAEGGALVDPEGLLGLLKAHRYVDDTANGPKITSLGRRYLAARTEPRFATPVQVEAVDAKARTATVVVVGWHLTQAVTVLLDQLTTATGVSAEQLPGKFLEADANCHAMTADEIVLTKIQVAPELPAGWMDGGAPDAQ